MTNKLKKGDKKHWSIQTAIDQIRKCDFECVGGTLANNEAWQWLAAAAKIGPTFWPGQGVWYLVTAETPLDKSIVQWEHFYIVGCSMYSDTERRLWQYNLSQDPPSPWHYGKVHFRDVPADKLFLERGD